MTDNINIRIARVKGYGNPNVNIPNWLEIQNAMELMEEIWEKCPQVKIGRWADNTYRIYDLMSNFDDAIGKSLSEAICLAWLEIFEKEEK